jgi:uncharacterized protein
MHDYRAIMSAILGGYLLPPQGHHGVLHWARVSENGLRIAEENGADAEVVRLFALFHDARRVNEHIDDGHGQRGGDLARSLRGSLVHLDDRRFELLYEACRLHTRGLTEGDATLGACWDADRLDLGRVGIKPRSHRLCTEAGRTLIAWAHRRALRGHAPAKVLSLWGYDPASRQNPD